MRYKRVERQGFGEERAKRDAAGKPFGGAFERVYALSESRSRRSTRFAPFESLEVFQHPWRA
jgi:hypothetical protein